MRIYYAQPTILASSNRDRTTMAATVGTQNSLQTGAECAKKSHHRPHLPALVHSQIGSVPREPKFRSARTRRARSTGTRKTQMKMKKNRKKPQTSPKRGPPGMAIEL